MRKYCKENNNVISQYMQSAPQTKNKLITIYKFLKTEFCKKHKKTNITR